MKILFRNMASRLFALTAAFVLALSQGGAQAQPAYSFSQQELDQMLAPIALYPDALLSQILMAATYPLEVAEAAGWAGARPNLSGDEAVREAETEDWDPSVKSLVAFPQVLARMGEYPQWVQALGDAFLEQESQVMDTVQALRRRAQIAGNLRSDDRLRVIASGPSLLLQPYDPQVVYVPYYDTTVVYGTWWWPAYPPVYFRPWPGYHVRPAYAAGFYWGSPIGISAGFFFGAFDWHQRHVRVGHVNNYYYNNARTARRANVFPERSVNLPGAWHHDPDHRRGLRYRSADAQRRFGAAGALPERGNQVRGGGTHRFDRGMEARPDARFELRRGDVRTGVETRANPQSAPVAPIDIRSQGRRPDARPGAPTAISPAPDTALARPVDINRSERRRDARPYPQPALGAPTEIRIEGRRPDARLKTQTGAPPARDAALARPVDPNRFQTRQDARPAGAVAEAHRGRPAGPEMRREPGQGTEHTREPRIRQEWHASPRPARIEPNARIEAPRAPQPRMEVRPAPSTARREPSTMPIARPESAARHALPQVSAPPRTETRPPQGATRQETRANAIAPGRSKAPQ